MQSETVRKEWRYARRSSLCSRPKHGYLDWIER